MSVVDDKEIEKSKKLFQEAIDYDQKMANDIINYINMQINDASRLGYVTQQQQQAIGERAVEGLHNTIYMKHYKEGEMLVDKRGPYNASCNYMMLMFTRVLYGRDRLLELENIKSKQQITVQR